MKILYQTEKNTSLFQQQNAAENMKKEGLYIP